MTARAICASHDAAICRLVDAALAATFTVEHVASPPTDPTTAVLLVADRACRRAAAATLAALRIPVILVADDLDDDALISLMHDAPVSHLIEDPRDPTLEITSHKLASGDLWGLEKYLAAGAPPHERLVHDAATKRHAIAEVTAWAASSGARRPLLHRLSNVVDELLMNALLAGAPAAATLRFASDARTLAISVLDASGTLHQRDLIHHLRRARTSRRPRATTPGSGAGLGLYLVVANVSSLIVNVAAGRRTEIVCLFDLPPSGRPLPAHARSLHVFAAP